MSCHSLFFRFVLTCCFPHCSFSSLFDFTLYLAFRLIAPNPSSFLRYTRPSFLFIFFPVFAFVVFFLFCLASLFLLLLLVSLAFRLFFLLFVDFSHRFVYFSFILVCCLFSSFPILVLEERETMAPLISSKFCLPDKLATLL